MKTLHAQKRAQQRGIPPFIDELLDLYGCERHDGHGGVLRFFNKKSVRAMERDMGRKPVSRLAEWLRAYKVVTSSFEDTITTGKLFRRVLH
ncbi:hypothetical protein [Propionivibrio sp.]|uniref:hypothetical protein n=1 Tax=Propionivibrio sp. TaxID=2212460 RepID=UPI002622F1CB|nr:hypothetical protein [Propionivibrio sp.]